MSLIEELYSLQGKVALVTGASSGIGRCMAETLSAAGASVVLVARRRSGLEAAAKQIAERGAKAAILPCNLADRAELSACAAAAADCFGAPDILVNAAGVNIRKGWANFPYFLYEFCRYSFLCADPFRQLQAHTSLQIRPPFRCIPCWVRLKTDGERFI